MLCIVFGEHFIPRADNVSAELLKVLFLQFAGYRMKPDFLYMSADTLLDIVGSCFSSGINPKHATTAGALLKLLPWEKQMLNVLVCRVTYLNFSC